MYKRFLLEDNTWERWASCRATVLYNCPKCGAPAEYYCSTPKGRTTNKFPHAERMNLLSEADWNKCRVKSYTIQEVLAKMVEI